MSINDLGKIVSPVSKSAKLLRKDVKGKNPSKYISTFNSGMLKKMKGMNNHISIRDFQTMINKRLPGKEISVTRKIFSYFIAGQTLPIPNANTHVITGFKIKLATNLFGKLGKNNLATAIHELTHVLDFMLNPKKSARESIINKKDNKTFKKFAHFYKNVIYNYNNANLSEHTYLSNVEKKTRNFFQKIPEKDRIDYIQLARYEAKSEDIAFREGEKTDKKIFDDMPISFEMFYIKQNACYMDKKSEILKKIGFEEIQKIREAHRAHLVNN